MMILEVNSTLTVLSSAAIFLVLTLLLVIILLLARHYLVATGKVKISINDGKKEIEIESGKSLLNSLHEGGVMLSSACGGKGSCGQCKIQVLEGGGDILPTETVHFSRKEQQDHWRLGCQVKVKDNMKANGIPEEQFRFILGNIISDQAVQDEVGYGCYDIVVANILHNVLTALTPVITAQLKEGGIYITSGILNEKEQVVRDAMEQAGLTILEVTRQGEWCSITAQK